MSTHEVQKLGRVAWEAVHEHGAFVRDFPDVDYYSAVGKSIALWLASRPVTDEEVEASSEAFVEWASIVSPTTGKPSVNDDVRAAVRFILEAAQIRRAKHDWA